MDLKPPLDPTLSISRQILGLSELAERLRDAIQEVADSLPHEILEDIEDLSEGINRASRKIAEREMEREDLLALSGVGQVVNSSLELDDVLRVVMDTIVRLTGAERGFLMLRDNQDEMSIRIARNWEQETLPASEHAISTTIVNRVITAGQPVLTTNAQQDPRFGGQESIIAYNLRSILCVPLQVKGELTGVIYADNRIRSGLFTEADRRILSTIADQAAVAIENARLFESVRRTLGEVTQLKNLMDDVFASIASGVITIDEKGIITLSNRAAEEILADTTNKLAGQPIQAVLPWLAAELAGYFRLVSETNHQLLDLEIYPHIPGRGQATLRLNLSPLKIAEGNSQGVAIVLEDLTEKKLLEEQRRLFECMVSPAVIQQLYSQELPLEGKRAQITTLFADIRGFTSFSERREPEQLLSVLNRYLGAATEAILAQEGTIDKFPGDALMVFFNAPIAQSDHTIRAMRAALGIQQAVKSLQHSLPEESYLSFGIGIHFGEAVLGLVGTQRRMEYTAIGDSINTAKRIQENAIGGQILISADVYAQVAHLIQARPVNPVIAKGKRKPLQVYELLGLKAAGS